MIRLISLGLLLAAYAAALTPDQKEADFRSLATMYAKNYAPYEWKRDTFQFDLLNIGEWVRRARASVSDLEFLEICAEYVAALQDTHSSFSFPTTFSATLGFHTDIYDGKVVVDTITRATLPAATYPFQAGWEVITFDGLPVQTALEPILKITSSASPNGRLRRAAQRLTFRGQSFMPRLPEQLRDTVRVTFRSPAGEEREFEMPWIKSGTPILSLGNVPMPRYAAATARKAEQETEEEDIVPVWVKPLNELRNESDPSADVAANEILNYGSFNPIYPLPTGFQRRPTANFLSGTFSSGGHVIGLLRIPNFGPASTVAALREFDAEIAFFQANAAGLIIDVTRNNGGDACYNEEIQRRLIPYEFRGMARELRATTRWLLGFSNALESAKAANAAPHIVALLTERFQAMERAFTERRGRTGPIAICAETFTRQPAPNAFTKPLMVLMDEFSTSAADAFPAIIQDARRGPIFGHRSNGAGGTTGGFYFGTYSEAYASLTAGMHHRREPIITSEYPASNYVENVGVRPDIPYDMMTMENLLAGNAPYVRAFVAAMVEHINKSR